ncbi:hypothetical protein EXE41_10115 [Halorubrum sp. SD690R]|uniref:hypothetical protein n=1 Tax=Halorubrum sp. SD690R TaxID=2518117 RepID=UPI0010F677F3|nr:hypothetical protein [Halorubrum sp. SD690R]TKX46355.1 hypothetical protein EXE41_10115 [Halorubrum sp. SD690R]
MIDYDTAVENVTAVEQTPLAEQAGEQTKLEAIGNSPAFPMLTVESNTKVIPNGSQSCLIGPRVPRAGCFGVSQ